MDSHAYDEWFALWTDETAQMRQRIRAMRVRLHAVLNETFQGRRNFDYPQAGVLFVLGTQTAVERTAVLRLDAHPRGHLPRREKRDITALAAEQAGCLRSQGALPVF